MKWWLLIVGASLLYMTEARAHGLSPQRMTADSGTRVVVAQFVATNLYRFQDRFSVECFKGDLTQRHDCQAIPQLIVLSPNATRKFKVKINTESDDVYLVCTVEEPAEDEPKQIISRVCSRIGVGVDPTPKRSAGQRTKHRPATNAVATGSGQG